MRSFAWLALGALALAAAPAPATAQTASQCAAAKLKASGGYVAGFAKCLSKGLEKAVSPDPLCVAKAQTKLVSGFEKAERRDDCRTFGDASPVQDVLDDGLPELLEVVDPPPPTCCDVPGAACGWTADVADCTAAGGVAGAAGSVCNGDGSCAAPDAAAPAFCCNTPILPPELIGTCYGGPLASIGCDDPSQELIESGLCHPALGCLPAGEGPRSRCSAAKLKAAGAFASAWRSVRPRPPPRA